MEISKDKLQKLLAQEKEAREQRERYYEQIIFDYEHKVMELGQEKRKCERLENRMSEYLEFINQLTKENERLNKESRAEENSSKSNAKFLTKKEKNEIQSLQQKKMNEMEAKIKILQDKLGNKTVLLSTLADNLKRYAELYGLKEGKELLKNLSFLLKKERAWTNNVESLENFFIEAEKENKKPLLNLENNNGGVVQITETEKQ